MIGRLRGVLAERGEERVIVDCGGVGYDVTVSTVTHAALPPVGGDVTLRIYTQVQETKIALYGFASAEERQLFDLLITVKNVGPATAIVILSGATSEGLARTIAEGDVKQLVRIRGVGKKTAELIVVELKDKCAFLLAGWGAAGGAAAAGEARPAPAIALVKRAPRAPMLEDVASALVNLGWRTAEVDRVVARLEIGDGTTIEALLRDALRQMTAPGVAR